MLQINQTEFNELCLSINQVCDQFTSNRKEVILLYGYTGEGKTTLLNCMAQKPMRGIKVPMVGFKFQIDNPIQGTVASGGIVSQTLTPFFFDKFCDTQGLGDTRGAIQEIINAFSIHSIVKNTKKIKILLIVSQNTLEEPRKQKLLKFILNLGQTFENTDELIKGLCLVVTQTQEQDSDEVRKLFSLILEEEIECTAQKRIIQHFASRESQIKFFRSPISVKTDTLLDNDRRQILEAVDRLQYLVNPEPSMVIQNESKLLLIFFVQKVINRQIAELLENHLISGIETYLQESLCHHQDNISDLRQKFRSLGDYLTNLMKESDDQESDIHKLLQISMMIDRDDIKKEISVIILKLDFVELILPGQLKFINPPNLYRQFDSNIKQIQQLISAPHVYFNEISLILTITGILIGMEDIQIAIKNYRDMFFELNVLCFNSFFIDQDLNLPGIALTLISPNIFIVGQSTICLKGKFGEKHTDKTANNGKKNNSRDMTINELDGQDGLPGMPGYNGGNFYGKANKIFGLSSLTINVEGGEGGKGQNGGNGAKGLDGGDGGKQVVIDRQQTALKSRKELPTETILDYIEKISSLNKTFEEIYQYKQPGQQGGNAGQGGIGGVGGRPGVVDFEIFSKEEALIPIILAKEGSHGNHGLPGFPGKGGNDGPTYRGVYHDVKVLPSLRNINQVEPDDETINETTGPGMLTTGKKITTGGVLSTGVLTAIKVSVIATSATIGLVVSGVVIGAGLLNSITTACTSSKWAIWPEQIEIQQFQLNQAEEGTRSDKINSINARGNFQIITINKEEKIKLYQKYFSSKKVVFQVALII